jgi:hypothetical protein
MYTGTLIDDLMAAVDRAEEHVELGSQISRDEQAYVLAPALYEVGQSEQNLLGAA